MGPKRKGKAPRPPVLAQGGRRFTHVVHGECELLPEGQWVFKEEGASKGEPHVYFHVIEENVPEDVRADNTQWDEYDGIFHEHSDILPPIILIMGM